MMALHNTDRFFSVTLSGLSLTLCLLFSGSAHAVDICTGWGSDTIKTVDLGLPATLDLTVSNSTANSILSSGVVNIPPLYCKVMGAGGTYSQASINWLTGSTGASDIRTVAPGLGLRLKYLSVLGHSGSLPSLNSGGNETDGLNWTSVSWELVRLSDTITPGTLPASTFAQVSVDRVVVDGGPPTLILISGNPVTVSAACTLSVDKSLVILPDTSTLTLMEDGRSDSVPLTAGITCPGNTNISNGTTLTLGTAYADTADMSLVGNTGTASGVAIEVSDDTGNRVSASGGRVQQAGFIQSNGGMPGATEAFTVRMVRQPAVKVTPGTIQGTFTLTLTTN